MKVESLIRPFQARLRSFVFGSEMDRIAEQMLVGLSGYRKRRADVGDRMVLKALSLLAEYLDAHGRGAEAASLLRLTVEELMADAPDWPSELAASEDAGAMRRLMRQRVWCCLAYALALLRANRLDEAGRIFVAMRTFVEQRLIAPDFACHGTLALVYYYEGLWRRNLGKLNEASWDFDAALDFVHRRYEAKKEKYQVTDAERLRREWIYSRVGIARILGFGHGGIALSRGRYVEARAWMVAAQLILAQLGQEVWRRSLEVYRSSAAVLVQEVSVTSIAALEEHAARLRELEAWFGTRNRRNVFIAGSFAILAEVRLRQIRKGGAVDLRGLRRAIEARLREAYLDTAPLSGTAALRLIECLLRAGDLGRCEKELVRLGAAFGGQEDVMAECQVLRAEVMLGLGRVEDARGLLTESVETRPANRAFRARAWALLAECELRAGHRVFAQKAMEAARGALEHAQDGYARMLVEEVGARVGLALPLAGPMPYQDAGQDGRWYDLDHNLAIAKLNVVEAVHRRHPDYSVERLAAAMGRGPSWLYGFLGKHRELEWVRGILVR